MDFQQVLNETSELDKYDLEKLIEHAVIKYAEAHEVEPYNVSVQTLHDIHDHIEYELNLLTK